MSLDLDLTIQRGTFSERIQARLPDGPAVIVGRSGAGKTTLLMAVAGLVRPTRGYVRIGGRVLDDVDRGIFVPAHRRGLGVAFQEERLFPHLSVADNLGFGRRHRNRGVVSEARVFAGLHLTELLSRRPEALSGGEKKRVGLGRALLAAERGVLLDEPFAGLNPELAQDVGAFLLELARQMSCPMVIVTHVGEAVTARDVPVWTLKAGLLEQGP